jgi:transcriptional regulator with XRE-family HTH domain
LRQLRKAEGLSAYALAEKLGVSETSVWEWESPKHRVPDVLIMLDVCDILGVSIEEIYPLRGGIL